MARSDFTKGSIPRNILSLALPMTLAQLVSLLYNIVDRIYLGRIPGAGRLAITGVGLCLPVVSIVMAFANLCGTGGGPLFSISRGKGEDGEAERIMGASFTLLLLFAAVLTVTGLLLCRPILYLFGASDVTFPYAADYLAIYLLGTVFVMVSLGMNPFINAQGFGRFGMLTVVVGAAINLVLDPVLIFGFNMGVRGAAIATVFSQGCSALWVLRFLTGRRTVLRLRLSAMRLELRRVGRIISLGLSGFIMQVTNSLVQILANSTLQAYGGDLYVGVMTVVNSVREIISLPAMGMTSGSQPVLGYNYGAGEYGRVREGIRFMSALVIAISTTLWAVVMLFPGFFIRLFNDDPELLTAGVPAFRVYFAVFFCMTLMFCGQSAFVALGRSRQSIFFSLLRKAGIVAPCILFLPRFLGVYGVFLSEPISNLVVGVADFLAMYVIVYRRLDKTTGGQGGHK